MSTYEQLVAWNEAGLRIFADLRPENFDRLDAWCEALHRAEAAALRQLGHPSPTLEGDRYYYGEKDPANCWHTVATVDGQTLGMWADHPAHAVVSIVAMRGVEIHGVWADRGGARERELRADAEQPALFSMFELVPVSHDSERSTDA